jgi:hypothetical protein
MCDLYKFEKYLRECYENGDNNIPTCDIMSTLCISQKDIERWCEIIQLEKDMEYYLYDYNLEGCILEFYF